MILSPAKINLSLKIKTKLKNGYHFLSSHVFFLNLYDKILIKESVKDCLRIIGPFGYLLNLENDNNLITKTLEFCRNSQLTNNKFSITLEKNIPVSSGLGGGSANSASIIRYFLNTRKINDVEKIIQFSKSLGADVPACIYSKPIFMEGIGERISFINLKENLDIGIVLINPYVQLSTKTVFNKWLPESRMASEKRIMFINSLQDFLDISNIGNDLEKPAIKIVPKISFILKLFKKSSSCLKFGMSGSGPTCYGIFSNRKTAIEFKNNILLSKEFKDLWVWAGGVLSNSKKRDLILPIKYN